MVCARPPPQPAAGGQPRAAAIGDRLAERPGILNKCRSRMGARLLRVWMLRPTRNIARITERHDAIACLCEARHREQAESLVDCVRNLKNVPVRRRSAACCPPVIAPPASVRDTDGAHARHRRTYCFA